MALFDFYRTHAKERKDAEDVDRGGVYGRYDRRRWSLITVDLALLLALLAQKAAEDAIAGRPVDYSKPREGTHDESGNLRTLLDGSTVGNVDR
jgi:hypothetical protein